MSWLWLVVGLSLIHTTSSAPAPHKPTWLALASIPLAPRQEHTAVFLPPSTIAILGGIVPDSNLAVPFDTVPLVQFYSTISNAWSSRAPIPQALNHLNVAVFGGKIYVLGGLIEGIIGNDTANRAWIAAPDSWVYDPSIDTSNSLPDLPQSEARGSAEVGVYDGNIYISLVVRQILSSSVIRSRNLCL